MRCYLQRHILGPRQQQRSPHDCERFATRGVGAVPQEVRGMGPPQIAGTGPTSARLHYAPDDAPRFSLKPLGLRRPVSRRAGLSREVGWWRLRYLQLVEQLVGGN